MATLLRFNQTPESTFYVCACNTHIARNQDFITRDVKSALFRKVFNVRVNDDPKHQRQKDGCILGDVHCINCNKILGFKFISVAKETPNQGFKEGRFILHLDRGLLYWNGKMACNAQVVQPDVKNKGLIEFSQAAIHYFYVCRKCCTHIARCQDFAVKNGIHGWFENAVNVRTDGPERYRTEGTNTIANAYCSRCNLLLGTRVVSSEQPHPTLKEDRLLLRLHDLLYWNGKTMCDAEDLHPVGDCQHNYYFYL